MRARRHVWFVVGFLTPAILLYALFVIFPLGESAVMSLFVWKGVSNHRTFVGAENYTRLLTDDAYHKSIINMVILLALAAPLLIGLGVGIAHWLTGDFALAKLARKTYLLPHIISMVVVAILWQFLYSPSFGLINSGLNGLHLQSWAKPWLGDPQFALPAVIVAFIWYNLGFYVMLFTAGTQAIPSELKEAAALDGSVGWNRFVRVTWPLLWSIKKVALSYIVINVMNTFALVYLMTKGGPDRATEMPLTYLYERGFTDFRFGDAAAIGMVNLVIAVALSGLAVLVFKKDPTRSRA